jgi:predicted  nucleic acid-binding Zn-ribbon protein
MGKLLESLLELQRVERDLAHVRRKLKTRSNAVAVQTGRVVGLEEELEALGARVVERRKDADRMDLDLKSREEQAQKLRGSLNTAKTNKEYAAVLTQLNTLKADNAKIEENALRVMQDVDALRAKQEEKKAEIAREQERLEEIKKTNQEEMARLNAMLEDLQQKREAAAAVIPPRELAAFDRIAQNYGGEAMAPIEVHGNRPPYQYVCGGCYMSLTAEHANALKVRDEVRTCDSCGRILYLVPEGAVEKAE